MPQKELKFTGQALLDLIANTVHPIKVFRAGDRSPRARVNAHHARLMLRDGEYEGGGHRNKKRCYYIREIQSKRPSLPFVECWRTTQAAVFWPLTNLGA